MQALKPACDASFIGRRESSFLAGTSSASLAAPGPCKSSRHRRRRVRIAAQGSASHAMPPNPATASATATRRRALFGYGAVLALGHVTGAAMTNPGGAKFAAQTFGRNEALHNVKKLQKATSRSFKGMRQNLAAAGSRSFKEVRSLAKAGAKSFKGLQRQLSRAGSQTYADLVSSIDQAGAAVKSNVQGAAHCVEETLRSRAHDVVGKLGDVSESFEDLQMESVEKVEDAKAKAISELADLIEDAGDAVKFLRWASEMYQTVSATS